MSQNQDPNKPEQLTELEQLRMENIALKYQNLQTQLKSLVEERQVIIIGINHNHPGYEWNDNSGLVPIGGVNQAQAEKVQVIK
jgi:hypothetical protein